MQAAAAAFGRPGRSGRRSGSTQAAAAAASGRKCDSSGRIEGAESKSNMIEILVWGHETVSHLTYVPDRVLGSPRTACLIGSTPSATHNPPDSPASPGPLQRLSALWRPWAALCGGSVLAGRTTTGVALAGGARGRRGGGVGDQPPGGALHRQDVSTLGAPWQEAPLRRRPEPAGKAGRGVPCPGGGRSQVDCSPMQPRKPPSGRPALLLAPSIHEQCQLWIHRLLQACHPGRSRFGA